METDTQ